MREKLRLDAEYAQNPSLRADLGLIGRTLVAIVRKLTRSSRSFTVTDRKTF
jgi:lipopolysaccharide/colanic/teichoic acid biosynthesis glycosyltransferase